MTKSYLVSHDSDTNCETAVQKASVLFLNTDQHMKDQALELKLQLITVFGEGQWRFVLEDFLTAKFAFSDTEILQLRMKFSSDHFIQYIYRLLASAGNKEKRAQLGEWITQAYAEYKKEAQV